MKKIDCHTHLINRAVRDRYFRQTAGYAIVMQFVDRLKPEGEDCIAAVTEDPRLALCAAIDLTRPIPEQLQNLQEHLDEWKIVGLKVYLTYQHGRADAPGLDPLYRFAERNWLSVTFHTGLTSLVLPSDDDMEGSRAVYAARAAERYPGVNIILSHMDDPRFDECIALVSSHENLFTDFSGAYEDGTEEASDIPAAAAKFRRAISRGSNMNRKILYGTDYCPPLNMAGTQEYEDTVNLIFPPEDRENVYFNNCLRAYPKLKEYLSLYE